MGYKELMLGVYPSAIAETDFEYDEEKEMEDDPWIGICTIYDRPLSKGGFGSVSIGSGCTEDEAWENAWKRIRD